MGRWQGPAGAGKPGGDDDTPTRVTERSGTKERSMPTITPHLWFDQEAKEAAEFYCSVFPNSKITNITTLHNTPSGDGDVVSFELSGQPFMAISAGPLFTECGINI
jgi:hypothetical protein